MLDCPAMMPRGPGTTPLSRTCFFQQHTARHLHQPPQHTTYLRLPPATLEKAQWHLPILTT